MVCLNTDRIQYLTSSNGFQLTVAINVKKILLMNIGLNQWFKDGHSHVVLKEMTVFSSAAEIHWSCLNIKIASTKVLRSVNTLKTA